MSFSFRRFALATGAFALLATGTPGLAAQEAESRHGRPDWIDRPPPRPMSPSFEDCRRGDDSRWCDRRRDREEREHAQRERERREEAKKKGVVTGVVGALIGAAVIGALVNEGKKDKENKARQRYCLDRYGNYDPRTDSYRASDGRFYRCA